MKKLVNQILKFGIVGIIATVIDYIFLVLLTEVFNVYYLLSACISFIISVIFNYLASMKFVFESKNNNKTREFVIFILLSIIGLVLNTVMMKLSVDLLNIHYIISKCFATLIVMIWNFVSRKLLLEKGDK